MDWDWNVIRNDAGQFLEALTQPFLALYDPLIAKLLAILEALKYCHNVGFHHGEFVSHILRDNKVKIYQ